MKTDEYFEIKSELESNVELVNGFTIEKIPCKEDYLGTQVIYWFTNKDDIFNWINKINKHDPDKGTIKLPRIGGEGLGTERMEKFINWIYDDTKRIGVSGHTGGRDDLILEVLFIDVKDGVDTKDIRRKGHVSRIDEVSNEMIGNNTYVRCWWD